MTQLVPRHLALLILLALGLGCGGSGRVALPDAAEQPPNVVVIMADDMGYSDIGPYGGEINTPTLDRLAAGGLRFTQFYNTARCVPTRASLLTGLYPHQAGLGHMTGDDGLPGYRGDLSPHTVTVAEALGAAGYATYMSGKWHVTNQMGHWTGDEARTSKHNWPRQRGFDRFFGTILGAGSFFDPVTLTRENEPVEPISDDFYYTDAISEQAVRYMDAHFGASPDRPFFLYVAYTAPHWPLHALPEDVARYRGRYDAGWDALRAERYGRMVEMGLIREAWALAPRDPAVPAWEAVGEASRRWYRAAMEVYAAQVDRMDQGIGQIVAALEARGELENTLIFFLADNGGCAEILTPGWAGNLFIPETTRDGRPVRLGNDPSVLPGPEDTYQSYGPPWANASNTPFRLYKHWVHEGGIASPLIVHWPARIEGGGRLVDEPGHVIDLMATALDVAGAAYPEERNGQVTPPLAGRSLVPAFFGRPVEREAIYWEHEGNRAVRQGRWKLVARHGDPWALYDMEADRTETHDLATRHPEKVDELAALYAAWADRSDVVPWDEIRARRR